MASAIPTGVLLLHDPFIWNKWFFHYNDLQSKAAGIKKALEQMQSMLLVLIFN